MPANEPRADALSGTTPDTGSDGLARREMSRRTLFSFITGMLAAGAGYGGWRWLNSRANSDGVPWPLRRVLGFNEKLARGYFSSSRQAQEFPESAVQAQPRVNGMIGLHQRLRTTDWTLRVEGGSFDDLRPMVLGLNHVKALPYFKQVTELHCIEGWTTIATWGGARLVDLWRNIRLRRGGAGTWGSRRRAENIMSG